MTAVSGVLSDLRIRLDEPTADEWTDAQLITYISAAEQWLAGDILGPCKGSGRFRYQETFTLTASTETYALSSLTKRFAEMGEIQMQWTSGVEIPLAPLREGEDAPARGIPTQYPTGLVIPKWTILGDNLKFLPVSGSARTFRIEYRWLPTIKTASGDTIETPSDYDDVLTLRAAHFANADAGIQQLPFEDEYATLIEEIVRREVGRVYGAATETIRRRQSPILFN